MAEHIVDSLIVQMILDTSSYDKGKKKVEKDSDDLSKGGKKLEGDIASLGRAFGKFFAVVASSNAIVNMALDVAKANDELNFLSRQLGLSTNDVKAFQNAAAASGGSAQGMTNSMKNLNNSLIAFKSTGDASMIPAFNALGVAMVDAQGNARKTDEVMLDLADSMSKMSAQQAYFYGQKIGLDEGTVSTLIQGRDAMREMIGYQKTLYQANKQDLENSRQLQKNRALLNAQWDSMKTLMASAVIPVLNKLALTAIQFFEFLQRHQHVVKAVFEALAFVIGVSLVGSIGKALKVLLTFIAPFTPFLALVTALAGAFVLLYDDYKTWAEGGNSLFKWDAFTSYIDKAKISVDSLRNAFKDVWKQLKEDTMPTLKGYVDILNDLKNGNFKEAGKKALGMEKNYIGKIADTIDVATGQEKGTMRKIEVVNHSNTPANPKPASPTLKSASGNMSATEKKKQAFIEKYLPVAQAVSAKIGGVPPNVLLGQWAQETGWGNSITKGSGYNLGNIKAGSSWKGNTVRAYDKAEKSNDAYRVYDTPEQFAEDYARLISTRKGYKDAIGQQSAQGYFSALQKGGYATDPNYIQTGIKKSKNVQDSMNRMYAVPSQSVSPNQTANNSQNSTKIDVKVGDIKVNTSSSTVTGVTQDATKAIGQNLNYLIPPQR